jgi:excisionase family DNA binding protein
VVIILRFVIVTLPNALLLSKRDLLRRRGKMGRGERPAVREFLDMLADILAEKYFERVDDRMKKIPELRRLITAKEAGQYLSLSTDTIYQMASLKKLPYLKIGARVLFDIKTLDHWIEKHLIKEKEWKREELKAEMEPGKSNARTSKETDLLTLLKKKGKD